MAQMSARSSARSSLGYSCAAGRRDRHVLGAQPSSRISEGMATSKRPRLRSAYACDVAVDLSAADARHGRRAVTHDSVLDQAQRIHLTRVSTDSWVAGRSARSARPRCARARRARRSQDHGAEQRCAPACRRTAPGRRGATQSPCERGAITEPSERSNDDPAASERNVNRCRAVKLTIGCAAELSLAYSGAAFSDQCQPVGCASHQRIDCDAGDGRRAQIPVRGSRGAEKVGTADGRGRRTVYVRSEGAGYQGGTRGS
jgi:hypothetical protein